MELAILIIAIAALVMSAAGLGVMVATALRLKRDRQGAPIADAVKAALKDGTDAINQNTALLLSGYNSTVDGHMALYEKRQLQENADTIKSLGEMSESMRTSLREQRQEVEQKLEAIRVELDAKQQQHLESTQRRLSEVREEVAKQLTTLREDNNKQLDRMRQVVDKELQDNLQTKLNQSFQMISDNLAKVYQSMGEMQSMTADMNDLKRVLSGVKTRGVWGEASLASLLGELLSTDQYVTNFHASTRSDRSVVEFAVRLPGKNDGDNVYLPIDSKFPRESYERLVNYADAGDKEGVEAEGKELERRIKEEARDIHDKYIKPPRTTDFAVLYVPIEGLYAEVMRREGLSEALRSQYHVMVAGPTTLAALLSSLQMGFKTLAVEKRSKEIWKLLAVIQRQFSQFAESIDRAEKQLATATKTLQETGRRTANIKNRLSSVQQLENYVVSDEEVAAVIDSEEPYTAIAATLIDNAEGE
jgi:DNA recombination protein RmuC